MGTLIDHRFHLLNIRKPIFKGFLDSCLQLIMRVPLCHMMILEKKNQQTTPNRAGQKVIKTVGSNSLPFPHMIVF